jgi:N-acetylmuramoyl-L-alanine amidase
MTPPLVHILLCHSPDLPGARSGPTGWSERTLAADVNGCMMTRLMNNRINVNLLEQDLLIRRIRYLKKVASRSPHQVVVEVHFDFALDRKVRGFSTLAHADSKHAMRLARCVHARVKELRSDAPDHGVCGCRQELRYADSPKEYPLQRLALLQDVPQWSVIPEVAFLSNDEDTKWASKFDNRRALGYSIATGIMDFLDTLTLEV